MSGGQKRSSPLPTKQKDTLLRMTGKGGKRQTVGRKGIHQITYNYKPNIKMTNRKGEYIIANKEGKLQLASKIKEVTAEEEQARECKVTLENGQSLKLNMSLRQVLVYLSKICGQKTAG